MSDEPIKFGPVPPNLELENRQLRQRIQELEGENTTLRAIASKIMPCHYCGATEIAKCPRGFPGCALADDLVIFDDDANKECRVKSQRIQELEACCAEMRELLKDLRPSYAGLGGELMLVRIDHALH